MACRDHDSQVIWLEGLADALVFFRDLGVEFVSLSLRHRSGPVYSQVMAACPSVSSQPPAGTPETIGSTRGEDTRGKEQMQVGLTQPAGLGAVGKADATGVSPLLFAEELELPPALSTEEKSNQLKALREEIGDCIRCKLCHGRTNIVFGEGSPDAAILFAGEGPGADEDRTGRPFVGRAGELLDAQIRAMTLKREGVYIANVVKCRPPDNRLPEADETGTCGQFLIRQIEIIQPKLIICLGATAAKFMLNSKASMKVLRGGLSRFRSIPLLATYHPAYLLRNPAAKRDVWEDLQKGMALLGIPVPRRSQA